MPNRSLLLPDCFIPCLVVLANLRRIGEQLLSNLIHPHALSQNAYEFIILQNTTLRSSNCLNNFDENL